MKQVYWSYSTVRVRWRNIQFEVKAGCELLLFMQHHRFSLQGCLPWTTDVDQIPTRYIYLISMRQKEREKDKERERIYSIYSLSLRERKMQASRRGGVKAWPEELKTVAYKANNVFELRFISGQLDALKSVEIAGCPELPSLESSCIIELSVSWLLLFCRVRKTLYHG